MSIPTTSAEIRQAFLDFFEENGHTIVPSAPLPNRDNPTLLFTNAGMNQFTDIFLGKVPRPYPRATTAQKVMRVQGKQNDLENVGPSPRHQTMFEMLGNFSFGDYFKREAIDFAWTFVTKALQLPLERLWASVYEEDDEARELWERYLPADRVLSFGKEENFWEMGEIGPCGPCSEIHYYIGDLEKQTPDGVNVDDDYLEFWNLVFMQFERQADGSLHPLPNPSVDTGMGLERVCQIQQNVTNNYETDLFAGILDRIQEALGDADEKRQQNLVGYRVIADHGRAATFLTGDGVLPGNSGEGYVLRMIIRRAARFGREIGFHEPFLGQIAETIAGIMGDVYPEVRKNLAHIQHVLTDEEVKFNRTLDNALIRLDNALDELAASSEKIIPGETAFTLYSTFGLPVEIARDVAKERGFDVDEAGFLQAQQAHALTSGGNAFQEYEGSNVYSELLNQLITEGRLPASGVDYDPYDSHQLESEIVGVIVDGELLQNVAVGQKVEMVTVATPFYVEAGGEVSDTGQIVSESGAAEIFDTRRPIPGLIVHAGIVKAGKLAVGEIVTLQIDRDRQWDIRRNHTATHLLHQALRDQLGEHVHQSGSLVAPDRLRFDFTHPQAVQPNELSEIEAIINQTVWRNLAVSAEYMGQEEAINQGAMALFGEKYGDIVRTIQIQSSADKSPYSFELCGGLHVASTSQIGSFHFVSEGAVAAGVRRVEAVTGSGAYDFVSERLTTIDDLSKTLNSPVGELIERLQGLVKDNRALQKEIDKLKRQRLSGSLDALLEQAQQIDEVTMLALEIPNADADGLRGLIDQFRNKKGMAGVAVLVTVNNGKPLLVAGITDDLVKRGLHAGKLAGDLARLMGGGGGGKPHMATAGGKDAGKLPDLLARAPSLVEKQLRKN